MELQTLRIPTETFDTLYYRGGKGEPLLYLHHLAGMQGWEPVHELLAEGFEVIAPYSPGFGPSDGLTEMDSGLDLVLHYVQLLDALGLESVHVVGHSFGGWVGAELAAIQPQRLGSLVLVNPVGLWDEHLGGADPYAQPPMAATSVLLADPSRRQELILKNGEVDVLENYVQEMRDLKASARFLWPIPDTGVARRLPLIKAPALVVACHDDRVVPAEYGELWREAIPGASLVTLANAGHLVNLEQPQRLAAIAANFLAGAE